MNHKEFAASIKAKYPQYADMPDEELTRAMMEKFPVYSDVDTTGMSAPPAQQIGTPAENVSQFQKLAPYFHESAAKGQGWAGRTVGALKDLASLPGRAAFASGDAGIPMQTTSVNTGDKVGDILANLGRDPWMIPAMLSGEGVAAGIGKVVGKIPGVGGMVSRIPAQAAGGALVANIPAATEYAVNDAPYDPLKTSLLGAGLGAAGEGMAMSAPYLQEQAKKLFLAGVKPRPRFQGGTEAAGMHNFLDKGLMPEIASPFALNPSQAGKKGIQIIEDVAGPQYDKAYSNADMLAARHAQAMGDMSLMVPKSDLSRGIDEGLAKYAQANPGGYNIPELRDAIKDAWSRIDVAGAKWGDLAPAVKGAGEYLSSESHVLPSVAKSLKAGFAKAAAKKPELSAPLESAMEGAADAARRSLGERFPEVAALNQKWAPWYGARDAFKTAAVRENRGVATNLINFANSPAFARGVDAAGRTVGAVHPLARLLMLPSARDATSVMP